MKTSSYQSLLAVVLAAGLVLVGCTSSAQTASPAASSPGQSPSTGQPAAPENSPAATNLDRALAELVAMPGGPPGVIAVVQVGDDRTVHSAGVADLKTTTAPAIGDHMRIASAAKAFSGATALSLVDKGVLSLDDTIGKWLPEMPKAWAKVTLRQLLSHTSGLPDFTKTPAFGAAVGASLEVPAAARSTADVRLRRTDDVPAGQPVRLRQLRQHRRRSDDPSGRPRSRTPRS